MNNKNAISTDRAPQAIGTYSQAIRHGDLVFISGQIPLIPETMEVLESEDFEDHVRLVFKNLRGICEAAGGTMQDIIKLNVFLTDMDNFLTVNKVMVQYFTEPYPARAAVGVSELPKGVDVEIEAIMGV